MAIDPFELAPLLEAAWPEPFGALGAQPAGRLAHQELIEGDTPAAGAEYVYRVPGDWDVRPLVVWCQLATDATAGNRQLVLELRDGQGRRYAIFGTDVQLSPSSSQEFAFQAGAPEGMWPVDDVAVVPLQPLYMWPTYQLALRIVGAGAGDQLSGIRLTVEKYTTARARRRQAEAEQPARSRRSPRT